MYYAEDTTTLEFLKLVDQRKSGIALGQGWGVFTYVCEACGTSSLLIKRCYTVGHECEYCGFPSDVEWGAIDPKSDGPYLHPVGWKAADIITEN